MDRGIKITLANGQLGGTLQTDDGISGMVLTGADESIGDIDYVAGTPILVTSLTNMAAQGISEAGNAFAYRQVKEFYDEAGEGAKLYLLLVAPTMTIAQMADNTNANGAKKLVDFAQGEIKLLGILMDVTDEDYTLTVANALDASVATAKTNMKVLATAFFTKHYPFRAIIGGSGYSGVPASLSSQLTDDKNRVSIFVGDTKSSDQAVACVGLALGRLSRISVSTMMSRVADGSLPIDAAYLNESLVDDVLGDLDTIADKGYITFRKFPRKSGYFFSGDDTCSPLTDDYHQLARGRVIDKAHIISYSTYVEKVDDSIPTIEGGKPEPGWAKWMEQQIINQLQNTLVANGEASEVDCSIPLDQDVSSTGKVIVRPRIRPLGYARLIEVELGFML